MADTFDYTVKVFPRDVEEGDLFQVLGRNLVIELHPVTKVEKTRRGNRTYYQIWVEGFEESYKYSPTQKVLVTRIAVAPEVE